MKKIILTAICLLIISNSNVFPQKEWYNWYFGLYAGITFNTPGMVPKDLYDSKMHQAEGCASISDSAGRLLFYTDGMTVWNRKHKIMKNGTGLKSHYSTTQSALIVPLPGSSNLYYLFTADLGGTSIYSNEGINYCIVDMNKGINGELIEKNIHLYAKSTEKQTAALHANKKDFWIITHKHNSDEYYVFLLNENGVEKKPVISKAGEQALNNHPNTCGYLKVSPDNKKLASINSGLELLEILSFDNETGIVSEKDYYSYKSINGIYSCEFSPDGTKVYFGYGSNGPKEDSLSQLDLTDIGNVKLSTIRVLDPNLENDYIVGTLQLGPDGKIYFDSQKHGLGVINDPDSSIHKCNPVYNYLLLSGRCCIGLPNCINGLLLPGIRFSASDTLCSGDTLRINAKLADYFLNPVINWTGPNGFVSDQTEIIIPDAQPEHSGWYVATVKSENRPVYTDSIEILVAPLPEPEISASGTLIFCSGDSVVLSVDKFPYIEWTTGDKTESITAKESGTFGVLVRNEFGCEAYHEVEVIVNDTPKPEIVFILGSPEFCRGDSAVIGVKDVYTEYEWSTGETSPEIIVKDPGKYSVKVTNEQGCTGAARTEIIVNTLPEVKVTGPESFCSGESITLSTDTEFPSYIWSTGESTREITVERPGAYSVTVRNEFGCEGRSEVFELTENPNPEPQITGNRRFCPGNSIKLEVDGEYESYEWNTGAITKEIEISEPGMYSVEVTDTNGCTGADTLTIELIVIVINGLDNVEFGSVYIGNEATKEITLTNDGIDTVSVESVSIKGIEGSIFSLTPNPQPPIPVPPGESIEIEIKFQPDAERQYIDSLLVEIFEPCDEIHGIKLTGEGKGIHVTSKVWLPDIVGKVGDKNFIIPLRAKLNQTDTIISNLSYTTEIRFNARFYKPDSITGGNILENTLINGDRVLKIEGDGINLSSDTTVLTEIQGLVLLGDRKETPLIINEFLWDPPIPNSNINGKLTITGVCQPTISLIQAFTPISIQVIPNPANEEIEINVISDETGRFEINIFTLQGVKVEYKVWNKENKNHKYNLKLNLNDFSNGIYQIILKSPQNIVSEKMMIIK